MSFLGGRWVPLPEPFDKYSYAHWIVQVHALVHTTGCVEYRARMSANLESWSQESERQAF